MLGSLGVAAALSVVLRRWDDIRRMNIEDLGGSKNARFAVS